MLNYVNSKIKEEITDVLIGEINKDDVNVLEVLDVQKVNGTVDEKVLWPGPATQLFLSTNKDNGTPRLSLPDNSYGAPCLTPGDSGYTPLMITVTPYPPNSAWRIRASSNNPLTGSIANTVFHGTQTLTINVPNCPPSTTEERWIEAFPAYKGVEYTPPRFRFFVRNTDVADEPGSTGTGSGGSSASSGVAYYWPFDNAANMLIDSVKGADLYSYRNPTTIAQHVMTADEKAKVGTALKSVYVDVSSTTYIRANSASYMRKASNDTVDKYAWFDNVNNAYLFTASDNPAAGDAIFDSAGVEQAFVVEDKYTQDPNDFRTIITAEDGTTDWTSDVTYSFFIRPTTFGNIRFGPNNNLIWSDGNRLNLQSPHGNMVSQEALGSGWWNGGIKRLGTHSWCHIAVCIQKKPATLADTHYTPEKGFGLVAPKSLKFGAHGDSVGPYYRDSNKDSDGRYAWTYHVDSSLNVKAPDEGHETLWTDVDEDAINFGASATAWLSSTSTENSAKRTVYCYYSTWYYRHDTLKPEQVTADLPYITRVGSGKASAYNQPGIRTLMLVYHNGSLRFVDWSSWVSNPFGLFQINFKPSNASYLEAIDETKISYHLYSPAEANADCSKIGYDPDMILDSANQASIGVSVDKLRQEFTEYKITVNGSVYIYDPLSTVFFPTTTKANGAHFGWEKISGNGADHIWTDDLNPLIGVGVYVNATDESVDDNLPVTAKTEMSPTDVPIETYLTAYVIDEQTIAVVADTHDWIMKRVRSRFPNLEAINWLNKRGSFKGGQSYKGSGNFNYRVWMQQGVYQPMFMSAMDEISNWSVDGNTVTKLGRWWECPGIFYPTYNMQWRNCKPGDDFYVTENLWRPGTDYVCGDFAHVIYLRLSTPMTEGSTHTVTWQGASRTFTYGRNSQNPSFCIKVNQEGYRTHGRRYAYFGQWLGSAGPYVHSLSDLHFYLVPSVCKYYNTATPSEGAAFVGEMEQRCAYKQPSANGLCSDVVPSNGRPLDGENTYQLEFTDFSSVVKHRLTIGNKTYLRDIIQDHTFHKLTTSLGNYLRDDSRDTCNSYAYVAEDSNNSTQVLYSDKETPTTETKLWLDFERTQEPGSTCDITNVDEFVRYGWTEERTDLADNWWTAETIWTDTQQDNVATPDSSLQVNTIYTNRCKNNHQSVAGTIDTISTTDTTGEYRIYIPHIGWSHPFEIGPSGMGHIFWVHERGMFHQRSGCDDVKHPYTNWEYPYASHTPVYDGVCIRDGNEAANPNYCWQVNPETHEAITTATGVKTALSGSGTMFGMCGGAMDWGNQYPLYGVGGGWFDAADFDMRPTHLIGIEAFAEAYINFPENFTDNQLDIPESGDGVPDILSEALWGAELYRKGQWPDGGVGTWFETRGHESDWPWLSTYKYYRVAGDYYGTIIYVKVAAQLAKALNIAAERATTEAARVRCKNLAALYTDSALRGWDYFEREFSAPYTPKADADRYIMYIKYQDKTFAYRPPLATHSGSAITETGTHAFNAAVALYSLTREDRFKPWITLTTWNQVFARLRTNDNWWGQFIAWALLDELKDDFPDISAKMVSDYLTQANTWRNRQESHTYRILAFESTHTYFGSLGWGMDQPDARGPLYVAMYIATKDQKWLDEIALAMDNMTGCNCMGRCWTAGLGKISLHRHLDHWVPRSGIQWNYWIARQGITSNYVVSTNYDSPAYDFAVSPYNKGRSDFDAGVQQFDVFPTELATILGASRSNLKSLVVNGYHPLWRCGPCYTIEGQYVAKDEFTVSENIMWKVAIAGVLMGKGFKPKPSYKQAGPVGGYYEEPNHVFLP